MITKALAAAAFAFAASVVAAPAASAGGGCHRVHEEGQSEAAGTTVEMSGSCFGPTVLTTTVGAAVTFVNRDTYVHNVTGTTWGHGDLAEGATFTYRFTEPGTYPYSCTLHPGMNGAVVVGAEPTPVANVSEERRAAGTPVLPVAAALIGGLAAGGLVPRLRRRMRPAE